MPHAIIDLMKQLLLTMAILFMSISCGGGGNSAGISAGNTIGRSNKSLFSIWEAKDGSIQTDFRALQFNTQTEIIMVFADGAVCDMQLALWGTESLAWGTVSLSTYRGATGNGNPGCAGLNGTYKATISGDTMTLCDPPTWTTCKEYE